MSDGVLAGIGLACGIVAAVAELGGGYHPRYTRATWAVFGFALAGWLLR